MRGSARPNRMARMIRVLLTAFEPWGEWKENSSRLCLRALEATPPGERPVELTTSIYPVDSRKLKPLLRRDLRRMPDFAIHLGQDAKATGLELETVGLNLLKEGTPTARPVLRGGPLALRSPLPADRWVQVLRRAGIPAKVSYHAGTYLCNAALYLSLHTCERLALPTRSLFIHLPLESSQVAADGSGHPSLPVAATSRAIRKILADLARHPS